jgi:hypothetical protein
MTYWFFYAYNAKSGVNHEGDWERISIYFDTAYRPIVVAYYHHDCFPELVPWANVQKFQGTHPLVFSALGGHASYPTAGNQEICGPGGAFATDYTAHGRYWYTWGNIGRAYDQLFYGYGGAWGTTGQFSATTGPLGPSWYKDPSPWTEKT